MCVPPPHNRDGAVDELICANTALVGHIVRETMSRVPSHVNRDDLSSAGLLALVQAAHSFDESRGVPFSRYASTRIRGALLDDLRSVDWASRSVRRRARDLDATRAQLAAALRRPATDAEVAASAGLAVEEVVANSDDVARASILSLQAGDDSDLTENFASNTPTPEQHLEHKERLAYLVEAIAELPERLRTVVEQYFIAERPMAEIAEALGVTESRISQIRAEALVLLRDGINSQLSPEMVTAHSREGGRADRRRTAYFDAVAARHATGTGTRPAMGAYAATRRPPETLHPIASAG